MVSLLRLLIVLQYDTCQDLRIWAFSGGLPIQCLLYRSGYSFGCSTGRTSKAQWDMI